MARGDSAGAGLAELLRRAEGGDTSALPPLRAALGRSSHVWRAYGDLAGQLERELVHRAAGDNLLLAEALGAELVRLRGELAGGGPPSPLVGLLARRAALGWLELHHLDLLAAQGPEGSDKQAAELGRRRDGAQRRYLAALKCLALVKKLHR